MNLKTSLWAVALLVFGTALIFTLSAPQAAAATTVYVDANVAASGSGTEASPFKTITAAEAAASNGDTIYLKNGTYAPSTNGETYPIISAKQLKIEGQTQDGVIINREPADPTATGQTFWISAPNFEFTKMTITGFYEGIYFTSTNPKVTYCTFEGYFSGSRYGSIGIYSSYHGNFSYNIFHDTALAGILLYSGDSQPGTISHNEFFNEHASSAVVTAGYGIMYISWVNSNPQLDVTDNIFRGTAGTTYLSMGFYSYCSISTHRRITIERNTISDATYGVLSFSFAGTNDYVIANNIIEPSSASNIYGIMVGGAGAANNDTAQIYNNVISGFRFGVGMFAVPTGLVATSSYTVANNTVNNASDSGIYAYSNSGNNVQLVSKNNVINDSAKGLRNGSSSNPAYSLKTFTSDYNDFHNISGDSYTNVQAGTHDLQKDPEFADKDNGDYTLNPSSLLIDAGTADSAPSDDIEGTSRPQGRGFDIGAYESIDWSGMFRIGNGYIATAPASQGGPQYKFFKYDGSQVYKAINAFNTDWRSDFKVQTADINGDGVDEIVAYAGAGVSPILRVYKKNGDRLAEVTAFNADFRGGLSAATGDFNNDGKIEIAVAPAASGGPQVQVYKYDKGKLSLMTQFTAYSGNIRGGLSLAAGDTDANGYKSIITVPSSGAGPEVCVYRYEKGKFVKKAAILAYGSNNRDGVNLTSTDMNRDGKDEIVTAPMNGKSNVRVYREENGKLKLLDWKMVFGNSFAGGVNISSGDVNADRKGEIILTPAHSGGPNLMVYQLNDENKLEKVTSKTVYASTMRAGYKTAVGDLNDDGTSEIAIVPTAPQTSNVQVFTMLGGYLQKVKSFMAYDANFRGGVNLAIGGR